PMRVLHSRLYPDDDNAARNPPGPERRRHPSLPLGQSLPLRHLPADHRSGEIGGAEATRLIISPQRHRGHREETPHRRGREGYAKVAKEEFWALRAPKSHSLGSRYARLAPSRPSRN